MDDPTELVRRGYDAIASAYLASRRADGADVRLLEELALLLEPGARVLDAGCGAGTPVTRMLASRFEVTGIDLSGTQVELARRAVPSARFEVADMTAWDAPDASFDAVVSYYAIIHVPRERHRALLERFHRLLRPGGLALLTMGAADNPDDVDRDWLGTGAPMYWSHWGHAENLRLARAAGFEVIWDRLVSESEEYGGGQHLFLLLRRR